MRLFKREPDEIIWQVDKEYIRRWFIFKMGPKLPKLYYHNQVANDEDRALHDHPAPNVSIILKGGYIEHFADGTSKVRRPGMIIFRRAATAHRLELHRDKDGNPIPSHSLFVMFTKTREWGFLCPKGWRHWSEFCDDHNTGKIGKGCD